MVVNTLPFTWMTAALSLSDDKDTLGVFLASQNITTIEGAMGDIQTQIIIGWSQQSPYYRMLKAVLPGFHRLPCSFPKLERGRGKLCFPVWKLLLYDYCYPPKSCVRTHPCKSFRFPYTFCSLFFLNTRIWILPLIPMPSFLMSLVILCVCQVDISLSHF